MLRQFRSPEQTVPDKAVIRVYDEAGNVIGRTSTSASQKSGERGAKQKAATPMKCDGCGMRPSFRFAIAMSVLR